MQKQGDLRSALLKAETVVPFTESVFMTMEERNVEASMPSEQLT
jgi:hypothetical protein